MKWTAMHARNTKLRHPLLVALLAFGCEPVPEASAPDAGPALLADGGPRADGGVEDAAVQPHDAGLPQLDGLAPVSAVQVSVGSVETAALNGSFDCGPLREVLPTEGPGLALAEDAAGRIVGAALLERADETCVIDTRSSAETLVASVSGGLLESPSALRSRLLMVRSLDLRALEEALEGQGVDILSPAPVATERLTEALLELQPLLEALRSARATSVSAHDLAIELADVDPGDDRVTIRFNLAAEAQREYLAVYIPTNPPTRAWLRQRDVPHLLVDLMSFTFLHSAAIRGANTSALVDIDASEITGTNLPVYVVRPGFDFAGAPWDLQSLQIEATQATFGGALEAALTWVLPELEIDDIVCGGNQCCDRVAEGISLSITAFATSHSANATTLEAMVDALTAFVEAGFEGDDPGEPGWIAACGLSTGGNSRLLRFARGLRTWLSSIASVVNRINDMQLMGHFIFAVAAGPSYELYQLDLCAEACGAGQSCSIIGGQLECTNELCGDGIDNDGDHLADCADRECQGYPSCQAPSYPVACPRGCDTHGTCNPTNGVCECDVGWQGAACDRSSTCGGSVAPAVTVAPSVGGVGDLIQQNGTGFTPGGDVELYFERRTPSVYAFPPVNKTADACGYVRHSYRRPSSAIPGNYRYRARDVTTGRYSAWFDYRFTGCGDGVCDVGEDPASCGADCACPLGIGSNWGVVKVPPHDPLYVVEDGCAHRIYSLPSFQALGVSHQNISQGTFQACYRPCRSIDGADRPLLKVPGASTVWMFNGGRVRPFVNSSAYAACSGATSFADVFDHATPSLLQALGRDDTLLCDPSAAATPASCGACRTESRSCDASCNLRVGTCDWTCGPNDGCSAGMCVAPVCGDGNCTESCASCPQDCGMCPPTCTCPDADGDGYFPTSCTDTGCAPRTDCNDADGAINPAAAETPCNGIDEDCTGADACGSSCTSNQDCPAAEHCSAGSCRADICAAGATSCAGVQRRTCSADGSAWTVTEQCSAQCGCAAPADLLFNGSFEDGADDPADYNDGGWSLYQHGGRVGDSCARVSGGAPAGSALVRCTVAPVSGEEWHFQLLQSDIALQNGQTYDVEFQARVASGSKTIRLVAQQDAGGQRYGLERQFNLTTSWARHSATFTAANITLPGGADPDARLTFFLVSDGQAATVEIDAVSLQPAAGGCVADTNCAAFEHCQSGQCVPDVCVQGTTTCVGTEEHACDARGSATTLVSACSSACGCGTSGSQQLTNAGFEDPADNPSAWSDGGWSLYLQLGRSADTCARVTGGAPEGAAYLRCQIAPPAGEEWNAQVLQSGVSVRNGTQYIASFRGRVTSGTRHVRLVLQQDNTGQRYGLDSPETLTTTWTRFEVPFTVANVPLPGGHDPNARITVFLRPDGGTQTVELDDFTLNTVGTCASDAACAPDQHCQGGACLSDACPQGQTYCSGTARRQCNANGSAYQELSACDAQCGCGAGTNVLVNPDFEDPTDDVFAYADGGWSVYRHAGRTQDHCQRVQAPAPSGSSFARCTLDASTGAEWHVQLLQHGIHLQNANPYTLSFRARVQSGTKQIRAVAQQHTSGTRYGLDSAHTLNTTWQQFTVPFTATNIPGGADADSRLTFFLDPVGAAVVELDDVVLK